MQEIPEWDRLSAASKDVLRDIAVVLATRVHSDIHIQTHDGGVRVKKIEVDTTTFVAMVRNGQNTFDGTVVR